MRLFLISLLALAVMLGGYAAGGQAAPEGSFAYPDGLIANDGSLISGAERQAITVMVAGFEAYNTNDPKLVKGIHWWLLPVKDKDVTAALVRSGIYRLHEVEIVDATNDRLNIVALFSREMPDLEGSMISFNRGAFTLQYKNGIWGITGYRALEEKDMFLMIAAWEKAFKHYGTKDLSQWDGLAQ